MGGPVGVHDVANGDGRDIAAIRTAISVGVTRIDTAEANGTLECRRGHGILAAAYRPIGKPGELSLAGVNLLDPMAAQYGKTPAQVAINWVIGKPTVVALVKFSSATARRIWGTRVVAPARRRAGARQKFSVGGYW